MKILIIKIPLFDGIEMPWTNILYIKLVKMFRNVIGKDFMGEIEWEIVP